jgi:membrane protein involved in D-alanine export
VTPYADFTYFGLLLLYAFIPAIVLGYFGLANKRLALAVTLLFLWLQYKDYLSVRPTLPVREIWIVCGYAAYQWALAAAFLRFRTKPIFIPVLILAILPLAVAKYLPNISPASKLGFAGISYVSFRALDVIFSIRDKVVTALPPVTYFAFLFFFPAVSSGPIDRFRRFSQDWIRRRSRAEFLNDLDIAIQRLFRGFLYKFIIAVQINSHWVIPAKAGTGLLHVISYMYAYTFYLFFDFAGYSAFAISLSYLLGVRTPENFNLPFLAPNIKDFWNRWHISLSFWFRDHIYMRFLLASAKGKWFKNKHTASYVGLFLTFGIMGVWHGIEWYYLLYGVYHAALLSGYDWFARWNKTRNWLSGGPGWHVVNILLTFHAIAFGLLLFSGHLAPRELPEHDEVVEKLTCVEITGYVWDRKKPNDPVLVDISMDGQIIGRVTAGDMREDLLEKEYGNGKHGFHFKLPTSVQDGKEHWVVPVIVGTTREIPGPFEITCLPKKAATNAAPATPAPATPAPAPPVTPVVR